MRPRTLRWVGAAVGLFVLGATWHNPITSTATFAADRTDDERRVPPVDSRTWKKLEQVRKLIKSEQFADAASTLETMVSRPRRHNKNELSLMHQMLGHAYWELEQLPKAIEHYERALDQVPFISEAMESTLLHTLAKLCFLEGDDAGELGNRWYSRARSAMESYLALATDPGPTAYYFLAQTHYALKEYQAGIKSVETAIRIAEEGGVPVKENWIRLLEYMRWKADADTG
ncbi:MAG: tetratricopeptide repeat protein [Gammaproteobacteria bacterium]|nr:tetratricopeptide repeat protein [Gammaproteobacteria bacterium]